MVLCLNKNLIKHVVPILDNVISSFSFKLDQLNNTITINWQLCPNTENVKMLLSAQQNSCMHKLERSKLEGPSVHVTILLHSKELGFVKKT